jgi:hypothetical protein
MARVLGVPSTISAANIASHAAALRSFASQQKADPKDIAAAMATALEMVQQVVGRNERRTNDAQGVLTNDPTALSPFTLHGSRLTGYKQSIFADAVLQNSWVAFGSGYAPPGYYLDPTGRVRMRGLAKSGTTTDGTILFTLPEGMRPPTTVICAAPNAPSTTIVGVVCALLIDTAGAVKIYGAAGSGYLSFEGVSFAI